MAELLIAEKLEKLDTELHMILTELKSEEPPEKISLDELRQLFKTHAKRNLDTTRLIRKMRDREYSL